MFIFVHDIITLRNQLADVFWLLRPLERSNAIFIPDFGTQIHSCLVKSMVVGTCWNPAEQKVIGDHHASYNTFEEN